MAMMSPKAYLNLIDRQYFAAKRQMLSRMDPIWGRWSGRMNRKLRRIINQLEQDGSSDAAFYKLVFVFWLTRSRMLEIHHRSRGMFGRIKMRKEGELIANIREQIETGDVVGKIDMSPKGIAEMVARVNGKG